MKLLMGADPEGFIFNTKTNLPVCADGLIPGDKEKPHAVECGAVQVDGMAAEFNINPAATEDEWVNNLQSVMATLDGMLPPDHEVKYCPLVIFSDEEWDKAPDTAKILGCDPDISAYTGRENLLVEPEGKVRVAGGHIHFGWTENMDTSNAGHRAACYILARELDHYLGVASAIFDYSQESFDRRDMYGKPGAIRIKPYGMEYRVLSNFWLQDEETMRWIYQQCHKVFNNLLAGLYTHQPLGNEPKPWVRECISYPFAINNGHLEDIQYYAACYSGVEIPKAKLKRYQDAKAAHKQAQRDKAQAMREAENVRPAPAPPEPPLMRFFDIEAD